MNTLGSLVMWMKLISAGVDDLAVSKHSEHVRFYNFNLFYNIYFIIFNSLYLFHNYIG